jgi:hypothetical protein
MFTSNTKLVALLSESFSALLHFDDEALCLQPNIENILESHQVLLLTCLQTVKK